MSGAVATLPAVDAANCDGIIDKQEFGAALAADGQASTVLGEQAVVTEQPPVVGTEPGVAVQEPNLVTRQPAVVTYVQPSYVYGVPQSYVYNTPAPVFAATAELPLITLTAGMRVVYTSRSNSQKYLFFVGTCIFLDDNKEAQSTLLGATARSMQLFFVGTCIFLDDNKEAQSTLLGATASMQVAFCNGGSLWGGSSCFCWTSMASAALSKEVEDAEVWRLEHEVAGAERVTAVKDDAEARETARALLREKKAKKSSSKGKKACC
eukprot:TRINITY_DN6695_c0_g1_i18.p1 TRINITY_DN6695_c0_g1~~TRINITY_DN6695_c0_g1_i18.p1  ORF type:complete len:265 (+),score=38.28 TRINITY_DN6695_c0_g1_i18:77-871(+)